jgi:hypothetical protein
MVLPQLTSITSYMVAYVLTYKNLTLWKDLVMPRSFEIPRQLARLETSKVSVDQRLSEFRVD